MPKWQISLGPSQWHGRCWHAPCHVWQALSSKVSRTSTSSLGSQPVSSWRFSLGSSASPVQRQSRCTVFEPEHVRTFSCDMLCTVLQFKRSVASISERTWADLGLDREAPPRNCLVFKGHVGPRVSILKAIPQKYESSFKHKIHICTYILSINIYI